MHPLIPADLFLSSKLYGKRPPWHLACYQQQPRWWFIEVGSWTLEVDLCRSK